MSMAFKTALQRLAKREPDTADAIEEFIDRALADRDTKRAENARMRDLLKRIQQVDGSELHLEFLEEIDAELGNRATRNGDG